jgi:hypothetical protein
MVEKKEDGVFWGAIMNTLSIPTEGEGQRRNFIKCPVCDKRIIGRGLHIYGYVVDPAVHEREVAAWRMGASGKESIFFNRDNELLSKINIPQAVKVDFYCHDFLCFAVFLSNQYRFERAVLPYEDNDTEKFKATDDSAIENLFTQLSEGNNN